MCYMFRLLLITCITTYIYSSYQYIIFDFGGVILDTPPDIMYDVDPAWASTIRGSYMWRQWMKGAVSKHRLRQALYDQFPPYIVNRAITSSLSPYRRRIDTTIDIITHLKQSGYYVYLLSNLSQDGYEQFIAGTAIEPLFNGIVCSFHVGYVKPDPRIYTYLLNKYNIPPHESIFIDDKPENVTAAYHMGINGIVYHSDYIQHDLYNKLV